MAKSKKIQETPVVREVVNHEEAQAVEATVEVIETAPAISKAEEIRLKELEVKMENSAAKYVRAYNAHESKKTLKSLKKAVSGDVDAYNLEVEKQTYKRWAAEGDPVKTAIRTYFIKGKTYTFKVDDETDYMTSVQKPKEFPISLPMMQATIGVKYFSDPRWFNKLEKLVFIWVGKLYREIANDNKEFDYNIEEASKEFNFDGIDPRTNEGAVAALQQVMDAILYIERDGKNIISLNLKKNEVGEYCDADWKMIDAKMTGDGGLNIVTVCNTGKFSDLVVQQMHRILTNGDNKMSVV